MNSLHFAWVGISAHDLRDSRRRGAQPTSPRGRPNSPPRTLLPGPPWRVRSWDLSTETRLAGRWAGLGGSRGGRPCSYRRTDRRTSWCLGVAGATGAGQVHFPRAAGGSWAHRDKDRARMPLRLSAPGPEHPTDSKCWSAGPILVLERVLCPSIKVEIKEHLAGGDYHHHPTPHPPQWNVAQADIARSVLQPAAEF